MKSSSHRRRYLIIGLSVFSDMDYGMFPSKFQEKAKKQDNLSIALPNLTLNYVQMNTYTSTLNIFKA